MQYHVLSFEGPDAYCKIGGLATRVNGLTRALADMNHDVHHWFVGDPDSVGNESDDGLHLHRWCQWISHYHRDGGVYAGEHEKANDFAKSLPPHLLVQVLLKQLLSGEHAVVLAEEWQTVQAVLNLDHLLRRARLRDRVTIIWTANNVFGFERIDWAKLKKAALIATVSRYMKYQLQPCGVDPVVIPNGLSPDAYLPPEPQATALLKRRFKDRIVITKMARWDPDKRWLTSVDIAADLKRRGLKPLLIARGGMESHGAEVLQRAHGVGLRIHERHSRDGDIEGTLDTLRDFDDVDMINLTSHVDADTRRVLFKASNVVLANSEKEPFGLVGLEAMAVGGIACTGCSGEDYAISGRNALVLQSNDPQEFLGLYKHLQSRPKAVMAMRREGRATAKGYAWPQVIERNLEPQIELARSLTA